MSALAIPSVAAPLAAARLYLSYGLSVIPIATNGRKEPADTPATPGMKWGEFQKRRPTHDELDAWFGDGERGVAIVGGAVSGGLEILDFDSAAAWEEWEMLLGLAGRASMLAGFPRARTPCGGRHLYLRHSGAGRNGKLARTADGKKTLIELKGEGGYVLAPGCPTACNPKGPCYEWEVTLEQAWGHA